MQNAASGVSSYLYSEVYGNVGMMSLANTLTMPLSIVFLILCPMVVRKIGMHRVIRGSLLLSAVMYLILFVLHMITQVNIYFHIIWFSLAGIFTSGPIFMQWGIMAEVVDYNEMISGKRTEGMIYSTFNAMRRVGFTIGTSAALLMLGWTGFDANLSVQPASTILGIKALCVLMPAIFVFISWIAFRFVWNITPEIREKIAAFKASQAENAQVTQARAE